MQKINLRELYPDVYKTDVFVDVAEEVVAAIRGQQQDDAAYERRMYRHKAHYSLNREDGIENDALNRPLTPEEILEQKQLREEVYAALMQLPAIKNYLKRCRLCSADSPCRPRKPGSTH